MKSKLLFLLGLIITLSIISCTGNPTTQNSSTTTLDSQETSENTLIPTTVESTTLVSSTTQILTTSVFTTTSTYTTEETTTNEVSSYSIYLETEGGILDFYTIDNLHENDVVTLPIPTREGYIFSGWYISIDSDIMLEELT
ncbi:MAG: hypothetical protein CVV59_00455, partial [Tenericutes bacterium HGW-Tenericutes-4]